MYGEEHFQPTWSSTILTTSYPGYGQRELCYSPLDWISVHVTTIWYTPKTVCWYSFILLGEKRHCDSGMECPRTQHYDPGQD